MCIGMHMYAHTCRHTRTHTCARRHAHRHTHVLTCTCMGIHAYLHANMPMHTHVHAHTCMYMHTHIPMYSTHVLTCTCILMYMHTPAPRAPPASPPERSKTLPEHPLPLSPCSCPPPAPLPTPHRVGPISADMYSHHFCKGHNPPSRPRPRRPHEPAHLWPGPRLPLLRGEEGAGRGNERLGLPLVSCSLPHFQALSQVGMLSPLPKPMPLAPFFSCWKRWEPNRSRKDVTSPHFLPCTGVGMGAISTRLQPHSHPAAGPGGKGYLSRQQCPCNLACRGLLALALQS